MGAAGAGPGASAGKQLLQHKLLNFLDVPLDLHGLTVDKGIETIIILVDLASNIYQNEPQQTSSKVPIVKD